MFCTWVPGPSYVPLFRQVPGTTRVWSFRSIGSNLSPMESAKLPMFESRRTPTSQFFRRRLVFSEVRNHKQKPQLNFWISFGLFSCKVWQGNTSHERKLGLNWSEQMTQSPPPTNTTHMFSNDRSVNEATSALVLPGLHAESLYQTLHSTCFPSLSQ